MEPFLAQQVSVTPAVAGGDALHTLATSGPIGAVCILLVVAVVYLWFDSKATLRTHAEALKAERAENKELSIKLANADSAKALALVEANDRYSRAMQDATNSAAAKLEQAKEAHFRALHELHTARVADANVSKQEMVEVARSCTSALTANSAALETQSQALAELREGIRDLAEESRERRDKRPPR